MPTSLKRLLIGSPMETERAAHEKLPKFLALPVFASDAMSSVAYATGEMMAALLLAGTSSFTNIVPLSIGIVVLLAIVTTSYRQTVLAYPGGGGAYIVARDNLGLIPAQVTGASLLNDYVLTVAVSISAGAAALRSLLLTMTEGRWDVNQMEVALAGLVIIALLNLRGVRESGKVIAFPSYAFILIMFTMIGVGVWKYYGGHLGTAWSLEEFTNAIPRPELRHGGEIQALSLFLLLHAFASGCAALTGVEAISDGVASFRAPAGKNAAITMIVMAMILAVMFIGVSFLAQNVHALPDTTEGVRETVVSQVARVVLGEGVMYASLQILTAVILVLAANTAFAGFPSLAAMIARDGFMPRQMANVGDRLVYDRGIMILAGLAAVLIVAFRADVHYLIPLYAVGVFLSFTLAQAGLVRRWLRLRQTGWQWRAVLNGFGSIVTFVVMIVFAVVKFKDGAWVVVILIPTLVLIFLRIHAHYEHVRAELSIRNFDIRTVRMPKHAVLVLIPSVTRGVVQAMIYARTLAGDVRGIHIETDPERTPRLRDEWMQFFPDSALVILNSPYRSVVRPLMEYLDEVQRETPNTQITVVLPEFVPNRFWQQMLHGQSGLVLKWALLGRKNVVVTNVRYHLGEESVTLRDMLEVQMDIPPEPHGEG